MGKTIFKRITCFLLTFAMAMCNTPVVSLADEYSQTDTPEQAETQATPDNEEVLSAFDAVQTVSFAKDESIAVHVTAPEGVFPAGATLNATKVTNKSKANAAQEAVESQLDENKYLVSKYLLDIEILDADGNEIEPDPAYGKVTVSLGLSELPDSVDADTNLTFNVFHINEGKITSATKMNVKQNVTDSQLDSSAKVVSFKTDSFSKYEFTVSSDECTHAWDSRLYVTLPAAPCAHLGSGQLRFCLDCGSYVETGSWSGGSIPTADQVSSLDIDLDEEYANFTITCSQCDKVFTYQFDGQSAFDSDTRTIDASLVESPDVTPDTPEVKTEFSYEFPSGSTAKVTDIVNSLKESESSLEGFTPVYWEAYKGSVTVSDDGLVTVGAGGDKTTDAIKIYGSNGSTIIVYVYSKILRVDSTYQSASFEVQWNDNSNEANSRPTAIQALGNYELQFTIDGTNYFPISQLSEKTGIDETSLSYIDNLESLNLTNYLDTSSDDSKWIFNLTLALLPEKYTVNGTQTTIQYRVSQNNQYEGYTYTSASTGESDETKAYAYIGTPILNTVLNDYEATLWWYDNENAYGTRPESLSLDNFDIYMLQTTTGSSIDKLTVDATHYSDAELTVTKSGNDTYAIKLTGLPNYDEDGNPVYYAIKAKTIKANESTEGDHYVADYDNYDIYSSYTDYLFDEGDLVELLTNSTTFEYNKVWDEQDPTVTRPSPKIYLYVIAEDIVLDYNNATTASEKAAALKKIVNEASAVQGYTAQYVPNTAGQSDFENIQLGGNLPLYDEDGQRLVYFAYELGAGSGYTVSVDNDESEVTDGIAAVFENITKNGQVKYALNEGTITNSNTSTTTATAEVTLHADSLQASVTNSTAYLTLQKYAYNENTGGWDWVDVTYGDYINATIPDGKTENDSVTEQLTGINGEVSTVKIESQSLPKYDADGNLIQYRYVETCFDINSGSTGEMSWVEGDTEGTYETSDSYYTGLSAPGVESSQNVSMFMDGKSTVDGYTTKIDNYIGAPLLVKATKSWFIDGVVVTDELPEASYVNISVKRDGTEVDELTLNSDNSWNAISKDNDRFDANGREYEYSIAEADYNDGGYLDGNDWVSGISVSYRVVDSETGEAATSNTQTTAVELVVNISNSPDPDSGIRLNAQKEWKDGGDISSEQSSYVGLFHIDSDPNDNRDSFGLLGIYELNKKNAWYTEKFVSSSSNNTIYQYDNGTWTAVGTLDPTDYDSDSDSDDYVFIEICTSGTSGFSHIMNYWPDSSNSTLHINNGDYTQWTNDDVEEIAQSISKNISSDRTNQGIIAADLEDSASSSEYTYQVSEGYDYSIIGTPCYTIRNTRCAQESFDLTKTWEDAGEAREAKYAIYKNGSKYITFTTNEWDTEGTQTDENTYQVTKDDGVVLTYDTSAYGSSALTGSAATVSHPTLNIKISNLQKYDDEGELITYELKEVSIYDEEASEWVNVTDDSANVAGLTYSATCAIDTEKEGTDSGVDYGTLHHNNDVTYWVGDNSVSDANELDFYKVWYDNGSSTNKRPNVYFNIYRASTNYTFTDTNADTGETQTTNVYRWLKGDYGSERIAFSTEAFAKLLSEEGASAMNVELFETVGADKLYNAGNDWLWGVDLGELEQYDEYGYPYVYFAVEGGTEKTLYSGNTFYGNMTWDELHVNEDSAASAKKAYDIYKLGDTLHAAYEDNACLIISDGVHEANGNPGEYYSRTIVNTKSSSRSISGSKTWKLPKGWSMGEANNPEVTFELYRTIEDYGADNGTISYTESQLRAWLDSINDKIESGELDSESAPEKVTEFTLNADSAGNYSFTGNSYVISTEPTTDASGVVTDTNLQKYDKYGYQYNYYVVEKTAVPGYPKDDVVYNFGTFHTDNIYEVEAPYVKISGQKQWKIDEDTLASLKSGETLDIKDFASVTVKLMAQAVTEDGEALAGADPIEISSVTLDPEDATISADGLTATAPYEFTEYKDGYIPYYGPNGVPFKFYVTESTATNGYSSEILYSTESSDGTVSYDKQAYSSDTVKYITLYETSDSEYKYQNNYNTGSDKDASFVNTYTPGTTSFDVQKIWSDNYTDNDEYRPDKVVFTVGRKVKNSSGTYVDDEQFKQLNVTLLKSDYKSTPTWSLKNALTNLDKYDPRGNTYEYYIVSETLYSGDDVLGTADEVGETVGNYKLTKMENGALTNTLADSTSVTLEKTWEYTDESGEKQGFNWSESAWSTFEQMRDMNILPESVKYVVERKTDGSNWSEVPAADVSDEEKIVTSETSGSSVLGRLIDIRNMTKGQYIAQNYFNGLSLEWDELPELKNGTTEQYTYRVVEYMTYKTGTSTTETFKYTGNGKAYTLNGDEVANTGVNGTITTEQKGTVWTVTAENVVQTSRARIAKIWNDNNGRDNTRPSKITVSIVPLDSTGAVLSDGMTYELDAKGNDTTQADSNTYYSDYFYVSSGVTPIYGQDSGNTYRITETWTDVNGASYTQVINSTGHTQQVGNTWTYEIENNYAGSGTSSDKNRKTISVSANKTWSGDSNWSSLTRPRLKYTLQYQTQGGTSWNDLTDETLANFMTVPTGKTASTTTASVYKEMGTTSYSQTWDYLNKYWDTPSADGVAEYIYYRVREEIVDSEGNALTTSYTKTTSTVSWSDSTYTDSKNAYSGDFKNTINTKTLYVKKNWTGNGSVNLSASDLTKLVNLKAIPEYIQFKVQYEDPSTNEWTDYKENGSTKTVALKTVDMATSAKSTGIKVPVYDGSGSVIQYRIQETGIKYSGESTYTSISWSGTDTSQSLDSITVTSQEFNANVNGNKTVTLTNDYQYVDKEIKKVWQDENNRSGLRSDFSVTLTRDGNWYGTVESLNTGADATVLGANFVTVTKGNTAETSNTWTVKYEKLPKYKADSTTRTQDDESVYAWSESNIPTSYVSTSGTVDGVETITNDQTVWLGLTGRGSISVTKAWDNDDAWKNITRADSIKVTLQYRVDGSTEWRNVVKKDTVDGQYPDGINVYANIDAEQTITIDGDLASTVTWRSLPKTVNIATDDYNEPVIKTVYYRVVEDSVTGYKLKSWSGGDGVTLSGSSASVLVPTTTTNTLDYTRVKLTKNWTKNGSSSLSTEEINKLIAINAIPEKVNVGIRYKIANNADHSEWADILTNEPVDSYEVSMASMLATGGYEIPVDLPKVDKDGNAISYQVYEKSVTYKNGTTVDVNWSDGTGYAGSMETTPASAEAPATTTAAGTATSITLTNDYEYTSAEVTKNWEDEDNRDGVRGDFSVTMYRDGNAYGSAISTATMTEDKAIDAQWGIVTKTVTGNSNQWKINIDYLPKYKADATTHTESDQSTYTWSETTTTANYAKSNEEAVSTDTAELNAYQPLRGNITVTKSWNDQSNKYNLRPEKIYVKLQWNNNGTWTDVTTGSFETVNNKNLYEGDATLPYTTSTTGWIELDVPSTDNSGPSYTWNDLSKNVLVNGKATAVTYRVIESVKVNGEYVEPTNKKLLGYDVTYSDNVNISATASGTNSDDAAAITNELAVKDLTVSKTWTGTSSLITPESVTFHVRATSDGGDTYRDFDDVTLTVADATAGSSTWSKTVEDLPIYDADGKAYTYKLTEAEVAYSSNGEDVTATVDGAKAGAYKVAANPVTAEETASGWTVSAENILETGNLTVSKTWSDELNRDGIRPASVTVTLSRDGNAVGKVTLGASSSSETDPMNVTTTAWSYTWEDLPVTADDASGKSVYTLAEDAVTGYETSYSANDVTLDKDGSKAVEVTNTHKPNHFDIQATKDWEDASDKYGVTWKELTYTLTYKTDRMSDYAAVEKTPASDDPQKVYTDNPVQVLSVTGSGASRGLSNQTVAGLDEALWTNLPEYVLNSDGTASKVSYLVKETVANRGTANYQPEYSAAVTYDDAQAAQGSTLKVASAKVTNSLELSSITVSKNWSGDDGETAMREPVKVVLNRDGSEIAQVTLGASSESSEDVKAITTTGWSYTFSDLPTSKADGTASSYTIEEISAVTGYTTTYTAGGSTTSAAPSVTISKDNPASIGVNNSLDKGSVEVTKSWSDGDRVAERPGSVALTLYRDGEQYETATIEKKADGSFTTATFENLPLYTVGADGKKAKSAYTVRETAISGYTASYAYECATTGVTGKVELTKGETAKATVTNTIKTGQIQVDKTWADENNRELLRGTVTVNLYRDGSAEPYRTWSSDADGKQLENWTAVFSDLPMYKAGGSSELSTYTLEETGYNAKYEVSWSNDGSYQIATENGTVKAALTNTYVPQKGNVEVTKSWNDHDSFYNLRPDQLTYTLSWKTADSDWKQVDVTSETVTAANGDVCVSENNPQNATVSKTDGTARAEWTNLPLYYQGKEITYKVDESPVSGYKTPTYTVGDTETNEVKLTNGVTSEIKVENPQETTKVSISKSWTNNVNAKFADLVEPATITYLVEYTVDGINWYPLTTPGTTCDDNGYVVLTADDNWASVELEDLPVHDAAGRSYQYRVSEHSIKYTSGKTVLARNGQFSTDCKTWTGRVGAYDAQLTIAQDSDNWITTSSNILPVGDLLVTKIWNDGQNRDGLRPTEIKVSLHRIDVNDSSKTDTVLETVSIAADDEGNWSYCWKDLPVYTTDGSTESLYYVEEAAVDQYTTEYSQPTAATLLGSVISLLSGTDANSSAKAEDEATSVNTDASSEIVVTNTHEPLLVSIEAQKDWQDNSNYYGLRDKDVTLTLEYSLDGENWSQDIAELKAVADRPSPATDDGKTIYSASANTQTISGDATENTWSGASWTDLSAYVLNDEGVSCKVFYRVIENETDVPLSYTATESSMASYDEQATEVPVVTVSNELTDTKSYSVTKTWETGEDIVDASDVEPDYVTVQLQYGVADAEGNVAEWTDVPQNGSAKLTPESSEKWSTATFNGLRADLEYRAVEVSATWIIEGAEKTVYVKDKTGAVVEDVSGTIGSFDYTSTTSYDEQTKAYTTVLNNALPETEFTVTKVWDDSNNADNLRSPVTINLYRDLANGGKKKVIATTTLSEANNWTYTWKNLPMYANGSDTTKSIYTVEEVGIDGYTVTYSDNDVTFGDNGKVDVTITNTHTLESSTLPKTGDNTPLGLLLSLAATSLLAVIGTGVIGKRRRKEEEE